MSQVRLPTRYRARPWGSQDALVRACGGHSTRSAQRAPDEGVGGGAVGELEVSRLVASQEGPDLVEGAKPFSAKRHDQQRESGPAPGSAAAFEAAVREEIGDPAQLFREYARSEVPVWRSVLLTGWGLYALSLLLPGFGIVAFQRPARASGSRLRDGSSCGSRSETAGSLSCCRTWRWP